MRRFLLAVVAGCAITAAVGPALLALHELPLARASSPGPAAVRLPWELLDCTFVIALLPVEDSALRARLPPGFEPTPPALALALPSPVHEVAVEVDDCASGSGLRGSVPHMQYASIWASARPPEEPPPPQASGYFVNWDVLVPAADRREQRLALPRREPRRELAERDGEA